MRFLDSLGIPIIGVLRDSQNFVHAAEEGIGVCEMQRHRVKKEIEQIERVVAWLDAWKERRRDIAGAHQLHSIPSHPLFQSSGIGSG
jgi:chromosome partitioning protein